MQGPVELATEIAQLTEYLSDIEVQHANECAHKGTSSWAPEVERTRKILESLKRRLSLSIKAEYRNTEVVRKRTNGSNC